jgi:hypothetical protein
VLSLPLTSVYETAAGLTLLPQRSAALPSTVALRGATVAQTVAALPSSDAGSIPDLYLIKVAFMDFITQYSAVEFRTYR